MNDEEKVAELRAVLQDLVFGADMLLPVATGSMRSYVLEVKRLSVAALCETGDREPEDDGECFRGGEAAAFNAEQQDRIQRELKR